MKFGPIPTHPLERLALATGRVPVPLLDALYGPIKARALMAGVRLGIFAALADGASTAADLAGRLHLDADTLDLLLRVLAFADYLVQDGDRYALSKLARRSLVAGGAQEMRGFVEWNYVQWELIGHLEEVLRTGRGVDFHATLRDPEAWAHYQRGMLEIARLDAPVLARGVPVPRGARRLLDLAGGHGLFGAALCRRHPTMKATVLDLPQAVDAARALAREAAIDDVVEHRPGDLLRDDLGRGWDVVLLCNVLHHFPPADVEAILRRAHAALGGGGVAAIWEIERPKRGAKPTDGDGAALYFRITSTGGAYHASHYTAWLQAAGFSAVRARRPPLAPGRVLVTARCL